MTDETKLFAPASREDVDMEKLDCFHLFYRKKMCVHSGTRDRVFTTRRQSVLIITCERDHWHHRVFVRVTHVFFTHFF